MSHLLNIRRALAPILATAAVLAVAAPATAAPVRRPAFSPGSRYLALGDSITFGYEEPTVVPAPDYARASTFLGYPEHIARVLGARVTNAACPGETAASFVNAKAQSNGCENSLAGHAGYRTRFPLHVRYTGSQLAYAVRFVHAHRDTRLVSLMIGANDLFLCQETAKDGCLNPSEQKAVITNVARNVRRILGAIRHAGYRGQLAIVNYYSLDYTVPFITNAVKGLNRAVDAAARPFGVEIADGFGEFLADARNFGGNSCTAGLLTRVNSAGACGVHPTYAGQALLAEALLRATRL